MLTAELPAIPFSLAGAEVAVAPFEVVVVEGFTSFLRLVAAAEGFAAMGSTVVTTVGASTWSSPGAGGMKASISTSILS